MPDRLGLDVGTFCRFLVHDVQNLQKVETAAHGCLALRTTVYLSRVAPGGLGRDKAGDDARGELEIQDAVQVENDVVAGHLATRVELHALAQVQLDLGRVSVLVPTFGERMAAA